MQTLRFLLASAGPMGLVMAGLAIVGAACNGALIAVVHRALQASAQSQQLALAFVALAIAKVGSAYASGRVAEAYSQRSVAALRRTLIEKLLGVPYRRLEALGSARAYATLTSDALRLHALLQATAGALVQAAIIAGSFAYLVYLDIRVSAFLVLLVLIGSGVYRTMGARTRNALIKARDEQDRLLGHLSALTSGAKELKLHAARRQAFLDGPLEETTQALMRYERVGTARYLLGQATNGLLVLGMIGAVLFALPESAAVRAEVTSGFVLTGLYVLGPLTSLLRLLPLYAAAQLSLSRIEDVGIALHGAAAEPSADATARPSFTRVELRGATHRYGERGFTFGPVSLSLERGQIVFVTGGNGSGKSTLAKLLVGLYEPLAGEVSWDGKRVTGETRDLYRQLFSAVFADCHVFDRLYGLDDSAVHSRAAMWIEKLGLAHVLSVDDGRFSTTDLSQGQRKRLALLTALLEDRPICVLDEWAAEQDAAFKETFYRTLLPELRAAGKTLLVITHDDRYFDVADRLLSLSDGHEKA